MTGQFDALVLTATGLSVRLNQAGAWQLTANIAKGTRLLWNSKTVTAVELETLIKNQKTITVEVSFGKSSQANLIVFTSH